MLKGYGDRSAVGGIMAIAMCVATAEKWDAAERPWRDATKTTGIFPFRMTNFVAATRGRESERLLTLEPIVTQLSGTVAMVTVAVMNEADWAILPSAVTLRLGNPYLLLATAAFGLASVWRTREGCPGRLTCVFESGREEGQDMFRDATCRMLDYSDLLQQEYGIESIDFAPKERAGLSMADTLAWLMTHSVPELKVDDGGFSKSVIAKIRERTPLKRIYLTRDHLLCLAHANTNEHMLALHARYGFGLKIRP